MDGPSNRNSGLTAGSDGMSARLNPPQRPISVSCVLLGRLTWKGFIMEQLEIIDLGDAMAETRCTLAPAMSFDNLWGPGHVRC